MSVAPSYDNCNEWKAVSLLQPNHNVNSNECATVPAGQSFKGVSIAGKNLCCPPTWTKISGDGSACSPTGSSGGAFCYLYGNDLGEVCPNPCGSVMNAAGITGFSCSGGASYVRISLCIVVVCLCYPAVDI